MPNGTPGDHPLTDLQVHGLHPFPAEAEPILLEVLELAPSFPDDKRVCKYYAEQQEWELRITDLARGKRVADTIAELRHVLNKLRSKNGNGG